MNGKRFDWWGWLGWIADQFTFTGILPSAKSKTPTEDARQEREWAALREQAREADLMEKSVAQQTRPPV